MSLLELGVPETYTFENIVLNLKAIKSNYIRVLSSFFAFNLHEKVICLKKIHDQFYSLNLDTWKIDRIWEFLNNDIEYAILEDIVNRQNSKKML